MRFMRRLTRLPSLKLRKNDPEGFRRLLVERVSQLRKRKPLPQKLISNCLRLIAQCDFDPSRDGLNNQLHAADHIHPHNHTDGESGYTINGELSPIAHEPSAHEIDRDLGWREPGETDVQNEFSEPADTLNAIIRFLSKSDNHDSIGLRAAALVTVVRPDVWDDAPTLAAAARKLGITRAALQKYSREIHEMTKGRFQSRCQRSVEVREERSRLAKEQHEK
jgi:hypothetical protein